MKKVSLFIASVLLVIVGVSCALWGLRSLLLLMGGAIILGFFSVIVLGMAIVINIFVENGKEEDDSKIRWSFVGINLKGNSLYISYVWVRKIKRVFSWN